MQTTLKKSCCITFQYEWKIPQINRYMPLFISKKVSYQNNDLFRAGVKKPSYSPNPVTFFFLTDVNLKKIGLKVTSVYFTSEDSAMRKNSMLCEMKEINLGSNSEIEDFQLFTAPLTNVSNDRFCHGFNGSITNFILTLTIYLSGIEDKYQAHQMDTLVSQQLLSSSTNRLGTDFNLITRDGKSFPVHKFILAARSTVFAALFFIGEQFQPSHAMDCTEVEMNRFVKFVYTGELDEGPFSYELMQLSVTYQIETLEKICRISLKETSADVDQMAMLALHLDCGSHEQGIVKCMQDLDNLEKLQFEKFNVFTCTWKVNLAGANSEETLILSAPFEHEEKKLFRAEFSMLPINSNATTDNKHKCNIKFLSYRHGKMCCRIDRVTGSVDQDNSSATKLRFEMKRNENPDKKILELFTTVEEIAFPRPINSSIFITFHVQLSSSVDNFVNKFLDSTWSEQLWDAAVNRKMTDVEFLVEEEAFGAHRSLLSTRSPVFAAMFASGMKEAETGQVRIEDVDPITFKHFLKFLYTGMLETSSIELELFAVADKYQVVTLIELCRPAAQKIEMDDIFTTFSFC